MNKTEIFKKNESVDIIDYMDYFFTAQVNYSLANETFVSAMLNGEYYDPDKIELVKCVLERKDGEEEEWYAVGETEEASEDIDWLYADTSLEKVTEHYKKLESEKRYKGNVILDFDSWEKEINDELTNGFIDIKRNPGNSHGYFARVSLYNDDKVLIEESLYTLDVDELQEKLDEGNNVKSMIAKSLNIDENDIRSVEINKKKASPGFERYYKVNIEFKDFVCEFESYISGELQHREKNVFSIIENDLMEAYEEAKEEYEKFSYEEKAPEYLIIK